MIGYFAAVFCAALLAAKDALSKRISSRVPSATSALASFVYAIPVYALVLLILIPIGVERTEWGSLFLLFVFLRATSDTFAEWSKMSSFAEGELSTMSALQSLSPVFLLVTAPLITGDTVSFQGGVGVVLVVLATLLFLWQSAGGEKKPTSRKGVLLALTSAFFFSINTCFDKLAVHQATPVWSAMSMNLCAAVFVFFASQLGKKRSSDSVPFKHDFRPAHGLFIWRGVLEVVFMTSKLVALMFLSAPYAAAVQRVSVVFSVFTGRIVLKEERFLPRLIASILLCSGIALILLSPQ